MPEHHDTDEGLDILEDMRFQEGDWKRERAGWIAMALILLAAVLGAFGHGLLGYRSTGDGGDLTFAYEQVARQGGVTNLEVTVAPGAVDGDRLQLHVSENYLDGVDVEAITPQPADEIPDGDGVMFEFALDEPPNSDITIRFDLRPDLVGTVVARIEPIGHTTLEFDQVLLP